MKRRLGFEIGRITGQYKGMYEITLYKVLNQNDIIRIDHGGEDVNLSVVKLYDREGNLINKADSVCYIKIKETASNSIFRCTINQRAQSIFFHSSIDSAKIQPVRGCLHLNYSLLTFLTFQKGRRSTINIKKVER